MQYAFDDSILSMLNKQINLYSPVHILIGHVVHLSPGSL